MQVLNYAPRGTCFIKTFGNNILYASLNSVCTSNNANRKIHSNATTCACFNTLSVTVYSSTDPIIWPREQEFTLNTFSLVTFENNKSQGSRFTLCRIYSTPACKLQNLFLTILCKQAMVSYAAWITGSCTILLKPQCLCLSDRVARLGAFTIIG